MIRSMLALALLGGCVGSESVGPTDAVRPDGTPLPAALAFTEVDFGEQPLGREPAPRRGFLSNVGTRPLEITAMSAPDESAGFFLGSSLVGQILQPDDELAYEVRWLPNRPGPTEAAIFVVTDADPDAVWVPVRGVAVSGVLTVQPGRLTVPASTPARVPLVLRNTGDALLTLSDAVMDGDPGLGLDLDPARNGALPMTLAPAEPDSGLPIRTLYVTWDPSVSDGTGQGTVGLQSDGWPPGLEQIPVQVE